MIHLMRTGLATPEETQRLSQLPEFRKATRNMTMAYASLRNLMGEEPVEWIAASGLVFGTSHGELEATKEFLKVLAVSKVARPTLFQNSLHNSTTGFLAMKLGLVGPAVTVSNGTRTVEDAFDLARNLLIDGMVEHCLVTAADGVVPDLKHVMEIRDDGTGEGAASLLLTTRPEAFAFPPIARFPQGFRTDLKTSRYGVASLIQKYDTSALEQVVGVIRDPAASGISILKRDGNFSELSWEVLK